MKNKKIYFFIAIIGWAVFVVAHFTALLAEYDIFNSNEYIWIAHIIIILAPGKSIFNQVRSAITKSNTYYYSPNMREYYRDAVKNVPVWIKSLIICSSIYAIVAFSILIFSLKKGSPKKIGDEYFLKSKPLTKTITKQEYENIFLQRTKFFSSILIVFYGCLIIILFPYKKEIPEEEQ